MAPSHFQSSDHRFPLSALPGRKSLRANISPRKLPGVSKSIRIRRPVSVHSRASRRKQSPLRRGCVSERLLVPDHIPKPPYLSIKELPEISRCFQIHDDNGISGMRAACELAALVLDYAGTLVQPSITTNEIDEAVHKIILDAGAYPSPLGYGGYPKSICTSINECMFHGIPDSRPLEDGDIINIDVTVYLNGYHGDTSRTFLCGDVDESARQLVKATEECLEKAISVCKDGATFQKICKIIREHAEKCGYTSDRFIGHGVGAIFHSEPTILEDSSERLGCMIEGQTFTIEPVLAMGSTDSITWDDGWTTLTADGSLAAQFEHTLLITSDGADVLTRL